MRNLVSSLVLVSLVTLQSFAGLPPTTLSGIGDTTKPTTFTFRTPTNQATKVNGVESMIETGNSNILKNPGAEGGITNWTASAGTFTATTTTGEILADKKSFSWDSSSAGQTIISDAVAIPIGLRGRNAVMSCLFAVQSGTATATMSVYDGSTSYNTITITSSATPTRSTINFIAASSGTVAIRLASVAADEPKVLFDSCFIGPADTYNISQVNQSNFVASGYIAGTASCVWSRTNTAIGAMTTTAACPGPTVELNQGPGTLTTTDSDLPRFTVTNLPPGSYEVSIRGQMQQSASVYSAFAISDGTTTSGLMSSYTQTSANNVIGYFVYTGVGDRSFELYCSSASGTCGADNTSTAGRLQFSIKRFPSSSELAFRPDILPSYWSGYHANNCEWATTSTSYVDPTADASCTFTEAVNSNFGTVTSSGSTQPNINWTPKVTGSYYVCATLNKYTVASANYGWIKLTDGTTDIAEHGAYGDLSSMQLCGFYNVTSLSAKSLKLQMKTVGSSTTAITGNAVGRAIDWNIFYITQGIQTPSLVGSITSGSTGANKLEWGNFTCGNTGSAVNSQSTSGLFTIANGAGVGECTITINGSPFSSSPSCTCSSYSGATRTCSFNADPTTTTLLIRLTNTGASAGTGASENGNIGINCIGNK